MGGVVCFARENLQRPSPGVARHPRQPCLGAHWFNCGVDSWLVVRAIFATGGNSTESKEYLNVDLVRYLRALQFLVHVLNVRRRKILKGEALVFFGQCQLLLSLIDGKSIRDTLLHALT